MFGNNCESLKKYSDVIGLGIKVFTDVELGGADRTVNSLITVPHISIP